MDNCAHEVATVPDQVEQNAPWLVAGWVSSFMRWCAGHQGTSVGCAPGALSPVLHGGQVRSSSVLHVHKRAGSH